MSGTTRKKAAMYLDVAAMIYPGGDTLLNGLSQGNRRKHQEAVRQSDGSTALLWGRRPRRLVGPTPSSARWGQVAAHPAMPCQTTKAMPQIISPAGSIRSNHVVG